ncbi:LD-carboxypeptidase [Vibrio chagasii]|nr:LD-carboxypeptidase [Vibrio chagasii]
MFAPIGLLALKLLGIEGFTLVEGTLTGKSDGYRSGSIQARAEELSNELNPEVRCIMSTIGGNNSNSLLPYV